MYVAQIKISIAKIHDFVMIFETLQHGISERERQPPWRHMIFHLNYTILRSGNIVKCSNFLYDS